MKKLPGNMRVESREDLQLEQTTKEIIRRIKSGDNKAFSELVKLYRNQVASLAYKMVNDYDEAADITQNVFMKTSRNIWRYDESKKFYTWLYRITVNASIDYMRKHHRYHHESIENVIETADEKNATPDITYQRGQLRQYINEAANSLSDKQRSAFLLRDVDGCHIDDVASIMNMPEATVRWYLHRARVKIRKELLKKCPQILVTLGFK
ncbi:MAG: sigma-70 family RNA polymerase sigma factor [Candidatus Zixiibacteriota bacterium]|nr:MAG: sigma-70 family RNA polymerase sigma factor [candidate division Zixibacteria bacterium]